MAMASIMAADMVVEDSSGSEDERKHKRQRKPTNDTLADLEKLYKRPIKDDTLADLGKSKQNSTAFLKAIESGDTSKARDLIDSASDFYLSVEDILGKVYPLLRVNGVLCQNAEIWNLLRDAVCKSAEKYPFSRKKERMPDKVKLGVRIDSYTSAFNDLFTGSGLSEEDIKTRVNQLADPEVRVIFNVAVLGGTHNDVKIIAEAVCHQPEDRRLPQTLLDAFFSKMMKESNIEMLRIIVDSPTVANLSDDAIYKSVDFAIYQTSWIDDSTTQKQKWDILRDAACRKSAPRK
jgi:hypothetical protein